MKERIIEGVKLTAAAIGLSTVSALILGVYVAIVVKAFLFAFNLIW